MTTYHITARNNSDGEVYAYQIRQDGNRFFLIDLFANESIISSSENFQILVDLVLLNHEVMRVCTF